MKPSVRVVRAAGRLRRLATPVGFALGLALFVRQMWLGIIAVRAYDFEGIATWWLVGSMIAVLIMYFVQMAAWLCLMRIAGARLTIRDVFRGYFVSFLPRYIPGTVWGYLSRGEWLYRSYGIGHRATHITSVAESLTFVLTATAIGGLQFLPDACGLPEYLRYLLVSGLLYVLCLVLSLVVIRLTNDSCDRSDSLPWALVGGTLLLYLLFWFLFGASAWLLSSALVNSVSVVTYDYSQVLGAVSVSWLLGFLAIFVPAGLGIREWSLAKLLVACCGLTTGTATMISVVSRVELILAELIWLGIAALLHIRQRYRLTHSLSASSTSRE